jgi:hypothetical protein
MTNPPSRFELLAIIEQAGGVIEDWRFARQLQCSTRDLAWRTESLVASGHLRRFQRNQVPCYELTGEERAA